MLVWLCGWRHVCGDRVLSFAHASLPQTRAVNLLLAFLKFLQVSIWGIFEWSSCWEYFEENSLPFTLVVFRDTCRPLWYALCLSGGTSAGGEVVETYLQSGVKVCVPRHRRTVIPWYRRLVLITFGVKVNQEDSPNYPLKSEHKILYEASLWSWEESWWFEFLRCQRHFTKASSSFMLS